MRFLFRIAFLVSILIGTSSFSDAGQAYFVIRDGKGATTQFEVTDATLAKVGTVTYKALLPGMDDKLHEVRGPLLRDLMKEAGLKGETVSGVALDKYEVDIPSKDFSDYDVIAAIEVDGKPLTVRTKGPAWIVYPSGDHTELQKNAVYEARSIWQLKELVVK